MITKVEAFNYRCLKAVAQPLRPYQILVGPNGSGKSAFLDVIGFLGDTVSNGLKGAVAERTENFHDLVWGREGNTFRLAIEARIPDDRRAPIGIAQAEIIRYEIDVRIDISVDEIMFSDENLSISDSAGNTHVIIGRNSHTVSFTSERGPERYKFELNWNYSGLANLPMDESQFPAAVWLKNLLREGVQAVTLNNEALRMPSPPGQGQTRTNNGSNLARLVAQLYDTDRNEFDAWVRHIQTALPEIENIRTVLRPEDKSRYVMVRYDEGVEIPSWMFIGRDTPAACFDGARLLARISWSAPD
jgi:predicted ATPase